MAETTGIAWTDHTWSPWIGCTKVSPGCDHCYAEALDDKRFSKTLGGTADNPQHHWGVGAPRYRTKSWQAPTTWNKNAGKAGVRRTVFPSLCDPFDNEVKLAWIVDLFDLIHATPNLTWLLLTKRIGNVAKCGAYSYKGSFPPNVWLGASVVNQEEADRDIPKLLAAPAAKRFVSYEPALGPVDFGAWVGPIPNIGGVEDDIYGRGLDWLIVGGESSQGGAKARPFDLAWARSTVSQCKAAGVPVFVKQLGSNAIAWHGASSLKDRAGADPAEWPEDLRVQEVPA